LGEELGRLTDDELADLQREYQTEHPDSHVLRLIDEVRLLREIVRYADRGATALSMEIQRVRSLLKRVYLLVEERAGTEELRAEIKRELA